MEIRAITDLFAAPPRPAAPPGSDRALTAGCSRNVRLAAGELVLREGEPADTFYLVRSGRVAIEIAAPGRTPMVIRTVGEGGLVGWSWLIPPYRWHFDARATEDTAAVAVDGACLRRKCDDDHSLGYRLMSRVAQLAVDHMQAARLQLLDLYGDGADG